MVNEASPKRRPRAKKCDALWLKTQHFCGVSNGNATSGGNKSQTALQLTTQNLRCGAPKTTLMLSRVAVICDFFQPMTDFKKIRTNTVEQFCSDGDFCFVTPPKVAYFIYDTNPQIHRYIIFYFRDKSRQKRSPTTFESSYAATVCLTLIDHP